MAINSHTVISDIFSIEYILQQNGMVAVKNVLIDMLREIFRNDREYRYLDDAFGFPLTPSHKGLDPNAGIDDDETTRIFIGSSYRYDVKFNPSIIVKNTGMAYKPISFNQDWLSTTSRKELIIDGYGNQAVITVPDYQLLVGAWDQTLEVKVVAESEQDREEIADIVMITLMGSRRKELEQMGVFIKGMRSNGEAEQPYANDYLYTTSITLDIRSEWRIAIPISDFIERLALFMTFDTTSSGQSNALDVNQLITEVDNI